MICDSRPAVSEQGLRIKNADVDVGPSGERADKKLCIKLEKT
jgi:hypothetical protein